jgi:hypothetical protein
MSVSPIQPGDVILFRGKSFLSRGIMAITKSKYSHAALAVSGTEVIEATGSGVEKNALQPLLDACDAYCVRRIPGLTVEQVELIKTKAYSLICYKYDTIQLVSLGAYFAARKLGLTWSALVADMPGRMICSELVAACMLCLPIKFAKRAKLVTPQTLAETDQLSTVIEFDIR